MPRGRPRLRDCGCFSTISADACILPQSAAALAKSAPQSCSLFSAVVRVIEPRLSLRSLAYSGSAPFRFSMPITPTLSAARRHPGRVATGPVAAHGFVGLQRVEHRSTSSTFRPTDPAVTETNWISLFGSTMKVTRSATPSALSAPGGLGEFSLDIRKHRKRHRLQIVIAHAPLEVHNSLSTDTPRI